MLRSVRQLGEGAELYPQEFRAFLASGRRRLSTHREGDLGDLFEERLPTTSRDEAAHEGARVGAGPSLVRDLALKLDPCVRLRFFLCDPLLVAASQIDPIPKRPAKRAVEPQKRDRNLIERARPPDTDLGTDCVPGGVYPFYPGLNHRVCHREVEAVLTGNTSGARKSLPLPGTEGLLGYRRP